MVSYEQESDRVYATSVDKQDGSELTRSFRYSDLSCGADRFLPSRQLGRGAFSGERQLLQNPVDQGPPEVPETSRPAGKAGDNRWERGF